MALISCPECKGPVSESAPTCPKCGFVLKKEGGGCLLSLFRVTMLLFAVLSLIAAAMHSWVWGIAPIVFLLLGMMVKRVT